jgi:hypothetical protein
MTGAVRIAANIKGLRLAAAAIASGALKMAQGASLGRGASLPSGPAACIASNLGEFVKFKKSENLQDTVKQKGFEAGACGFEETWSLCAPINFFGFHSKAFDFSFRGTEVTTIMEMDGVQETVVPVSRSWCA